MSDKQICLGLLDLVVEDESSACAMAMSGAKFDVVISISSIAPARLRLHELFLGCCEDVLSLHFCDTTDEDWPDGPKPYHIAQIQDAALRVRSRLQRGLATRVLIHCFAGLCRSPAAAQILYEVLGLGPDDALAAVKLVRRLCWPNQLMIELSRQLK